MGAAIAALLMVGHADYDRGYEDARDGLERQGPSLFALGSRYDEGYDDYEFDSRDEDYAYDYD